MWRELNTFGRLIQALLHIQTINSLLSPSSTVLDAHSTVLVVAPGETPSFWHVFKSQ